MNLKSILLLLQKPVMEDLDHIIVFGQFDSAIDANIVKTKLDAYGIPCFLSQENMANLYPGQHILSFKVRIHLFARDADHARQVLDDSNDLSLDTESTVKCPQCQSPRIERDFPRRFDQKLSWALGVMFFGILFPQKKIYRCQDCEFEFEKT